MSNLGSGLLDYDGKNFLLRPPSSPSKWVKEVAQAKWDPTARVWRLPDLNIYAKTILDYLPRIPVSQAAQGRLDYETTPAIQKVIPNILNLPLKLAGVTAVDQKAWAQLYSFQKMEVNRLVTTRYHNQLVVLEPGLGKTLVSLLAARLLNARSVLVITLKDLISQWGDEEEKWFQTRTLQQLHQQAPSLSRDQWIVTNYDSVVGAQLPNYRRQHWDIVILDESVLVKNRSTKRFKNLLALRKSNPNTRWWLLSGSPTSRYADDLWSQFHLLYPGSFKSYWRLARRYCHLEETVWGTSVIGSREDKDIMADSSDLVFVAAQHEYLPELPEEIPELVEVELKPDQKKAYKEMNSKFVTELESGEVVESKSVLGQMTRLQEIASNLLNIGGQNSSAKQDALVDLLNANAVKLPALVWVQWVPGARALLQRLRTEFPALRVEYIKGADSDADRKSNSLTFEQYKAGKIDILILSLPVGKYGQNLQVTRTSCYYDKTFSGDDFVQSLRRVKRIGLQHRPVILTLKAKGTIDELVEDNLAGKLPSITRISHSDLASMLRSLTGV